MATSFEELKGSPTVSVDIISGDAQGLGSFKILWANYGQFIYDLVGQWVTTGTTSTFVPASINFPGWPSLIVNNIAIRPFMEEAPASQSFSSVISATNSYPDAQVDVTYKPRQQYNGIGRGQHPGAPNVPNGTILEISSKISKESLSIPGSHLYFRVDGSPADNLPYPGDATSVMFLANNSFTLKWSRVPAPPWSAMRALEGLTNSVPFLGYPADQVFFYGANRDASFQINGDDLWTITYEFGARNQPWNQDYIAADGNFRVVVNSDNTPRFASGNFNTLFQFGS